ncbi:hypothetical protein SYNGFB01_01350 [Synechococcus sp. GFB01]|nr:hypothetical protein SYNGFB01_01350 [Synechococcus sp. GFB01]
MAPLIRFTLIGLYLALAAPLPWRAPPALELSLWLALILGLLLVLAATSEQVLVDERGLRVGHPAWCAWLLRRGWQLDWSAIEAITPVVTSQGGRVFYLRSGDRAYLLPQRIAAFEAFLSRLSRNTGLATTAIGRISPPWTYQLLAGLCATLLAGELAWGLLQL